MNLEHVVGSLQVPSTNNPDSVIHRLQITATNVRDLLRHVHYLLHSESSPITTEEIQSIQQYIVECLMPTLSEYSTCPYQVHKCKKLGYTVVKPIIHGTRQRIIQAIITVAEKYGIIPVQTNVVLIRTRAEQIIKILMYYTDAALEATMEELEVLLNVKAQLVKTEVTFDVHECYEHTMLTESTNDEQENEEEFNMDEEDEFDDEEDADLEADSVDWQVTDMTDDYIYTTNPFLHTRCTDSGEEEFYKVSHGILHNRMYTPDESESVFLLSEDATAGNAWNLTMFQATQKFYNFLQENPDDTFSLRKCILFYNELSETEKEILQPYFAYIYTQVADAYITEVALNNDLLQTISTAAMNQNIPFTDSATMVQNYVQLLVQGMVETPLV